MVVNPTDATLHYTSCVVCPDIGKELQCRYSDVLHNHRAVHLVSVDNLIIRTGKKCSNPFIGSQIEILRKKPIMLR